MSPRFHPIFWLLLLLAAVGFLLRLLNDPIELLLIIGLTALVVFAAHRYLTKGRLWPSGRKLRQGSQRKLPQPGRAAKKGTAAQKRIPFQVIEGNKGKTKPLEQEKRLP